jgi:outer membrane receptor protein involved in Fe transport
MTKGNLMNTRTTMKTVTSARTRLAIVVGAILLANALPQEAAAQSVNAALRGKAPAGTSVTATNAETGLTRGTTASSDGNYSLVGLPPGTYQVSAGPGTERTVTLIVASTATLNFEGSQVTGLGEVVVSGNRLAEVKTSEVGGTVSIRQIESTPQITRNFLEFADAVPGMKFEVDAKGNTQIRSGTLNTGATNVYIDGVGQKNYVRPSGITGQAGADPCGTCGANQITVGDPGNPFPQLAIAEYKVITSNYKAEYDQVSGAAITAVTRSGTNEFEASAFMTYTDADLREKTPAEEAAGTDKQGGDSKEYGLSIGGPIIKDRLHFFLTYEGKEFTTPNTILPPPIQGPDGTPLDYTTGLTPELRENYGPVANPFDEDLFFAKLDWQISASDSIELSGRSRQQTQQAGASGVFAESAAFTYVNDDERATLRWEHAADSFFNDAAVTYEDTNDSPEKAGNLPGRQYVALNAFEDGFNPILQVDGVDPRTYFLSTQSGWGIQDDITFTAFEWKGEHTLKAGVKYKDIELAVRDASTEALYSYWVSPDPADGGVEATPFQVTFGAQADPNINTTSVSKNRQYGIYFQDDWVVNNRLTFNIGVRYDYEETPTYTDYVTPQRFIDAIFALDTNGCAPDIQDDPTQCGYNFSGGYHGSQPGQTYADSLANAGIDINDYISNGSNRSDPSDNIAPRFGFSFDLQGDQAHVVFGGAARSYDRNTFSILQHETNKATLYTPTVSFWNDSDAVNNSCPSNTLNDPFCIPWDDAYLTPEGLATIAPGNFGEMHFMNNNLETPYSDQFTVGMRNIVGDWNTSAAFAYITSYDGVIGSSGNVFGDGTWYWYDSFAYAPSSAPIPNAGGGGLFLFDNAKATRTKQVLLSADKPYSAESGWSASIAYTYSDAKDRLEFNGDYQFDYFSNYDAPYVLSPEVAKHRLVAVGNVDVPWGITLGAKMVVETPKPLQCVCTFDTEVAPPDGYNYNYKKTAKFVEDTIGFFTLDLQATKTFQFGEAAALQLRVDVLNVTDRENYAQIFQTDFSEDPALPFYFKDGDLAGVPRTIKFSVNLQF